jgi:hypothetical protein
MKGFAAIAAVALAAVGVFLFWPRGGSDAAGPDDRLAVHRSGGMADNSGSNAGGGTFGTSVHGGNGGPGLSGQRLAELPKRIAQAGESAREQSGGERSAETIHSGTSETHAQGTAAGQGGVDPGTSVLASNPVAAGKQQNVPPRSSAQQQAQTAQNAGGADAAPDVAYASDSGQQFSVDSQVDIPLKDKPTAAAGSVSFWLQPQWEGKGDDAQFVQFGDSSLQVAKNIDFLRFEYIDPNGVERGLGMNIDGWKTGDWHQVTGTWIDDQYTLYVDGQLISQSQFPAGPDFQGDAHLLVGSSFPNGAAAAPGAIDQLTVLNHTLSPGEIAQQYKDGASAHR